MPLVRRQNQHERETTRTRYRAGMYDPRPRLYLREYKEGIRRTAIKTDSQVSKALFLLSG